MIMKVFFKYIFPLLFVVATLTGCTDDLTVETGVHSSRDGELPVDFNISLPASIGTRGFLNTDEVKRMFQTDDVIHILGTFQVEYTDENDQLQQETVKRYGALRFTGKQWEAVDESELTWPSTAVTGQFVAYYISESNGILTLENPSDLTMLSDVTPASDPLYASSAADIPYGFGVSLQFNHICAYLSMINMEPLVSDSYWFTATDGVYDSETMTPMTFNNAFVISLSTDSNGDPELNFNFTTSPDALYGNAIFIKGTPTTETDTEGNIIGDTRVSYFLQPAYYETFTLNYPATPPNTYAYLKYDFKNVPPSIDGSEVMTNEPDLQGGITYTLDIQKSPGISIETPPTNSGWDESDDYFDVDVEDFLNAATKGEDYYYTDPDTGSQNQILEKTPTGSRLLHNVDFRNFDYADFEEEVMLDLSAGLVFEGGLHYIRNLGSPLFRYNQGTIRNLGIKDVNCDIQSYETDDNRTDMSRNGALCHFNEGGTITNIRVYDVTLNVYIKSQDPEGQETHNVGGVVGSNTGAISDVWLSGTFNINVTGYTGDEGGGSMTTYPVNAAVLIGGVSGQNAAQGIISNVEIINNCTLNITNTCVGDLGAYSIGGIVGESSGFVSEVILPVVNIDSSRSKGVVSYIGGMVGQIQVSEASSTMLTGCIMGGTARAGATSKYGVLTSDSYIGGIAGSVLSATVTNCSSTFSIYGSNTVNPNVIYATGGIFGRVRNSDFYDYSHLTGYGSALEGPSQYIGNFVGIAPDEQGWLDWYATINTKSITVRQFTGLGDVGYLMANY